MYCIIYKITITINGKIYIGCHKTTDIHDDYMGSGKYLKRAIEKYGVENFQKEILHVFDTPEEMFHIESVLVNEEFVERSDTYNLKVGGEGGFDYINTNGKATRWTDEGRSRAGQVLKDMWSDSDYYNKNVERVSLAGRSVNPENRVTFLGKKHTEESKKKIGEANSIHQQGSGNSQYGTMWITNEVESKKIRKDEEIPEGWRKGR